MSNLASIRALKPPRRRVSTLVQEKMAETGGNNPSRRAPTLRAVRRRGVANRQRPSMNLIICVCYN
jgi:hypothetical protein